MRGRPPIRAPGPASDDDRSDLCRRPIPILEDRIAAPPPAAGPGTPTARQWQHTERHGQPVRMTSREATPLLALPEAGGAPGLPLDERVFRLAFAAVQWPWLLRSLYGGTRASKADLLLRLALPPDALPHLGSWKADTYLLHRLVDLVEEIGPATVVEVGAGATTLVLARALQLSGNGGHLISFDQHAEFISAMHRWLGEHGLEADLRHSPLSVRAEEWPGLWYDLNDLPFQIDLLIIDGPPWSVHPFARGAAEQLFSRVARGGAIVLDDAARPGERIVARRWRRQWPDIEFSFESGGSKGTLIGRKR